MVSSEGTSGSRDVVAVWEGVYPSFHAANSAVVGPGFCGDVWRTRSLAAARGCLEALEAGRPLPQFHKQRSVLLPAVAATMMAIRDRLRILDFGGGLGIGYMALVEGIPHAASRIDYTIVDVPPVVDEGRRLLPGAVRYMDALPGEEGFDLVHAASALQYVEDWRMALGALLDYRADFILLSDVFAGEIPTFVTLQNYYGSRIRHWFWNLEELLEVCSGSRYTLVMKTFATGRRLKMADTLAMDHFPKTHRLEQSLHLLLHRQV
jgi:putative methyltransferase (TIGR04325 family)